jgi:hypothetical protein
MITFNNAENVFQTYMPELNNWQRDVKPLFRIFSLLNKVTDLTVDALKHHEIFLVKKYLLKMTNIFRYSDGFMKTIIRKIYFEEIRHPFALSTEDEKTQLKSFFPSGIIQFH